MKRPSLIWCRRTRRQIASGVVLVAYLFTTLGVPVALAVPEPAAATPMAEKQVAHPCGCDAKATCCCAPQSSSCSKPCCGPTGEAPQAPGLSLSPLSCRCTTSNVWLSVGSVLPVPPASEWQPYFVALDWIGDIASGLVVIAQLPDVPPPRSTF